MSEVTNGQGNAKLKRYLSPLAVWALSVGSAIGWGSLVVTSKSYLIQAGPLGSILGLLIGLALMVLVAYSYSFLANKYPGTGGLYNYVKYIFGYDRAFLVAWFLFLVYISIFWANATSIPLFARYFLRGVFSFGYLYTVFGYDVYFGEVLATLAVIGLVGLLCMKSKKLTANSMVALTLLFTVGITVCFIAAMAGLGGSGMSMQPPFVPDNDAVKQVMRIAFISPWAFIGFESISHSAAEYRFKHSDMFRVLVISLVVTTALYVFVLLLSGSAYPKGCTSWLDYISRLDEFEGIEGLPAFYAANYYLGPAGIYILMASLLSLVITSLIGMLRAVSRLCYAVAQDGVLPEHFAHLSKKQIPARAILLVLAISLPIPFLGRTAIGWIVDTTTIGATILYGFASAAVFKASKEEGSRKGRLVSGICMAILIVFLAVFLFPNYFSDYTIGTETYALLTVWTLVGLLYFNRIIRRDHARNFGKAIIVWMALLAFIVLMATTWMERASDDRNNAIIDDVKSYMVGTADSQTLSMDTDEFIEEKRIELHNSDNLSGLLITGLFGLSIAVLLANYVSQRKWERQAIEERDAANDAAFKDPLTGVKSKHAFLLAEQRYDAGIKDQTVEEFAIVVCDVNGLKVINDTMGHKAGDKYIVQACRMICDIFQHSPVYRTGGDEFVVVLTERDYLIRKELLLALHDRSVEHIGSQDVVVSGGLSDFVPGEDVSFHAVFERADSLMYEEKKLLKSMGSITREDAEEPPIALFSEDEDAEILRLKRHVLIVEDEEINQQILAAVLGDAYELLYAADGIEALEQVKANADDLALVLLDLYMPNLDGVEVLNVMKGEKELEDIPVIVVTADQSAEVKCLEIGAIDFIPKPYPTPEVIRARVNRCIELSEKRTIIESTERDGVTNLFNPDYFLRYVRMFDQHYADKSMDAFVLDVNHFHTLNERYGKQYGDSVLSRIGRRIRQISRELGGVGCRWRADTFFVYCPHRDDYEDILDKVSEGLAGEDVSEHRVRLRMGVYSQVDKSLEIDRRFDYARIAANSVRSGYVRAIGIYDDEMRKAELYRMRLLEDFRPSLQNGHFVVYFQPKFDIRPSKPVLASAEALVRWNHPELGLISPATFIPLLEDSGLILELDEFVWRQTAARIREWKDRLGFWVPVSVNVSRIDMLTPNLKGIFKGILESYGLTVDDLVLEITESAYTGDSEQVISTAKELRGMGMGFRIEMDDFGTGYSSLGMLSNLPIDALKLDMSFVRSAFGESRDVRMIELIIGIADYLNVPVVAEGVETEEQYLVLKAMGCDLVQGYYFSRPVPPKEFEPFIAERAQVVVEMTEEVQRTSLSISQALAGNFQNIFYVDVLSGYYLEFHMDGDGGLKIRHGGTNFFGEARERLLADVSEEDARRVREATSKASMAQWVEQEDNVTIPLSKLQRGVEVPYALQTIKTRESDSSHIVIGLKRLGSA